jgi:putative transposase
VATGLKRFYGAEDLHFITCSCYQRRKLLHAPVAKDVFEKVLEEVRRQYGFFVRGYVVMPEHFHLLISEPERGDPSLVMQSLKQKVAKRLLSRWRRSADLRQSELFPGRDMTNVTPEHFWQKRFYDFNVWTAAKEREKLRYMHRNPVTRGLVKSPDEWRWSSSVHHLTGREGPVEIESMWTARRREQMGITPALRSSPRNPAPPTLRQKRAKSGAPGLEISG